MAKWLFLQVDVFDRRKHNKSINVSLVYDLQPYKSLMLENKKCKKTT